MNQVKSKKKKGDRAKEKEKQWREKGWLTLLGHDTFLLQITLVSNNDDGEIILVLHSEDLLLEGHDFFE